MMKAAKRPARKSYQVALATIYESLSTIGSRISIIYITPFRTSTSGAVNECDTGKRKTYEFVSNGCRTHNADLPVIESM